MTVPTLDSVNADLQATKAAVPTLEEQLTSTIVSCWKGTSDQPIDLVPWGYSATLLVAPINLSVLSVGLSFEYWSLPASDSAYWAASLLIGTSVAGFATAATRTTQNTGATANGGITARSPWTFNSAPGSPWTVPAGQLLLINWNPTGSPIQMKLPVTVTVRYAAA